MRAYQGMEGKGSERREAPEGQAEGFRVFIRTLALLSVTWEAFAGWGTQEDCVLVGT